MRLWTHHPDVLAQWQRRFPYLMVDEYQDTNQAQFKLVKLLGQRTRNVMVVGDDDQSIYAFRGADIRNILDFEKSFPGAEVVRLEQNYRSTGNILKAASAVVAHNQGRMTKTLWTDRGDGDKLPTIVGDDEQEQARLVVSRIRQYSQWPPLPRHRGDLSNERRVPARRGALVRAEIRTCWSAASSTSTWRSRTSSPTSGSCSTRRTTRPCCAPSTAPAAESRPRASRACMAAAEREVPLLEAARVVAAGADEALGFVACIDRLRAAVEDTAPGKLVELAASNPATSRRWPTRARTSPSPGWTTSTSRARGGAGGRAGRARRRSGG